MVDHITIISGGQSGVDRAALDFALKSGIQCGGFCPKGRIAEDGEINAKYPLLECNSAEYHVRTELNVKTSDATLVIYSGVIDKGTKTTVEYAKIHEKPIQVINLTKEYDTSSISSWISSPKIKTLNIAGPRESSAPGIHNKALSFLDELFLRLSS